jgi:type II secretion system protein G
MRKKETGFTLIELLIVIAIIGILAAIAIPNLLNALQRGKQKRTMADMRDLAIAIESYNTDNNFYPTAGCLIPAEGTPNTIGTASFALLRPTYIAMPPVKDGWAKFLLYSNGAVAGQGYTIQSNGRDGSQDTSAICGTTTNFNDDIVYTDGTFVEWPEGPQQ